MKIINDDFVLALLDKVNNDETPKISTQQLQIHIDYKCSCKVTQDKHGNSLHPCKEHYKLFSPLQNGEILHKYIN